ncbi:MULTISPECIES: NAD(P)H-hydrate dehydratase [Helicobacter]|uniref:Bifunctional NAD(P)H-hydrate repair enzyme n=1 Tax=Helicobacter ibis TaxID=2962633 RepID=A0ABT4VCJ3_9HELI|nr:MULTISPECIES: NAD(P)H-hydrate dehydratase [Helicobacter]MDA3966809.1 NAD(P)H-hydrate dehydratase [Helicobacter sp. WB40]MDA3968409.1 NAD(P)H-hydrate dehydratase [Helicobacter ibis]
MKDIFYDSRILDKKAEEHYLINSELLMENAAFGMKNLINKKLKKDSKILLVCGSGDNGADGLALARMLYEKYKIHIIMPLGSKSNLNKIQLKRLNRLNITIMGINDIESLDFDCIVDSLFGVGLRGEISIQIANLIDMLNKKNALKIACDIPSGIDRDGNLQSYIAFKAHYTLSMGALKVSLFSDVAKDFVGKIKIVPLGIGYNDYKKDSNIKLLEKCDFKPPYRDMQNCHKGIFGHLNVFLGEKEGAAIISSLAAFRSGAGLVSVISDKNINLPHEIMQQDSISHNVTAILLGMGYGRTNEILKELFLNINIPILLDADIFYHKDFKKLADTMQNIILTPHPKEFLKILEILCSEKIDMESLLKNKIDYAMKFSQNYPNITLLLKGANQIIAQNGTIYINPLGTNILAKGGSGDCLAGIIGGLLAQGYTTLQSCIQGSMLQALISKKLSKKYANFSISPLDLINQLRYIKHK